MNTIDQTLQSVTPTLMVPKFEEPVPLEKNGHRFWVASSGLWMEAVNDWSHVVLPVVYQDSVSMPYGDLSPRIDFTVDKLPLGLIEEFIDYARKQPTIEVAGWIIWNRKERSTRLQILESLEASEAHVQYVCPELNEDESLLIDIHSHGAFPAFFSEKDNNDDKGGFKVSVVVGNLDKPAISICARLCVYGLYSPLPPPFMSLVDVEGEVNDGTHRQISAS
jgi:PRTRC genetic system protein A